MLPWQNLGKQEVVMTRIRILTPVAKLQLSRFCQVKTRKIVISREKGRNIF